MDEFSREVVKGVNEAIAALEDMQAAVNLGTLKATKASQTVAKRTIKSGMNGAPRWAERGAIGRDKTVPKVNLHRSPNHMPRGGPVGKLTGTLRKNVGGMRRPKLVRNTWHGGVGVGGPWNETNMYRFRANGKYPFMKPGVDKAAPKIRAAYETAWAKATAPATKE